MERQFGLEIKSIAKCEQIQVSDYNTGCSCAQVLLYAKSTGSVKLIKVVVLQLYLRLLDYAKFSYIHLAHSFKICDKMYVNEYFFAIFKLIFIIIIINKHKNCQVSKNILLIIVLDLCNL